MMRLVRRFRPPVIKVIEIGATHLTAAEASTDRDHRLGAAGASFSRSWSSVDGEPGTALDGALAELRTKWGAGGAVHLVIPGHLVLTKVLRVPATATAQRERIIAFEARQAIPFPLEEVVWDYEILDDTGTELTVLLAAAKTEGLMALLDRVVAQGWDPVAVRPASVVLASMWRKRPPAGQACGDVALVLNLGARSTQLLFNEGESLQLRTVALGGNQVTRAIAERLGQSHADAERLKLRMLGGGGEISADSSARAAVADARAAYCKRLLGEVNRSVLMSTGATAGAGLARIWLAGAGAMLPGLVEALGEKLKCPVGLWEVATDHEALRNRPEWWGGTLVGEGRINLLPESFATALAARRRRPRWLVAAVLFIGALALPGWHFQRLASVRLDVAAALDRQAAPHHAWREQIQRDVAMAERLEIQAQQLTELVKAQGAWPGFLADLQERLASVDDVWLERMQVIPANGRDEDALRLRVSGRLLDRENPLSRVSPSAFEHATALLQRLVESPFVHAIEGERFDAADPGLLRFDFTLVINPATVL